MNSPLSALRSNARTSGSQSGAPCIGEIRQETLEDEAPSPFRQSPISQESAEDSKTAASSVVRQNAFVGGHKNVILLYVLTEILYWLYFCDAFFYRYLFPNTGSILLPFHTPL